MVRSAQQGDGTLFPVLVGRPAGWDRDVELLLAERTRLAGGPGIDVELPAHLSVSQLVELECDPAALARSIRRPLPRRPAPLARRGTRFHRYLEERWDMQPLLDVDELPGAADEGADDAEFIALREAFERSPWADRVPSEVEVPFDMTIDATVVRGRMDAVFSEADGSWLVVDWKTGRKPAGAEARAVAVQLAAYRLAWARLNKIPDERLGSVRAAFHYVRSNETVAPADLLDAAGLRALVAGAAETTGAA